MIVKRCRSLFSLILLVASLLLTCLLPGRGFAAANNRRIWYSSSPTTIAGMP
jgi:hypothetical protein